jgi:hypothetical protein
MGQFYDAWNKMNMAGTAVGVGVGVGPKLTMDQLKQCVERDADMTRELYSKIPVKGPEKPANVKRFELLGDEKALLYARKNKDYGDSFNQSLDEDGLLVSKIRLGDKYKRFCQLINNPAEVTEEKLRETLIDLSNYADMTIMWLDQKEEQKQLKKHNDSMDAMARTIVAAGADWDGDIVNGQYVNFKEGIVNTPSDVTSMSYGMKTIGGKVE